MDKLERVKFAKEERELDYLPQLMPNTPTRGIAPRKCGNCHKSFLSHYSMAVCLDCFRVLNPITAWDEIPDEEVD